MVREHDALHAGIHRPARVLEAEDALQHDAALPVAADQRNVVPTELRIDLVCQVLRTQQRGSLVLGQELGKVVELRHAAVLQHDVPQPARVRQHVELAGESELARREVAALVPLAGAERRDIGRDHQRLDAGLRRSLDQPQRDFIALQRIELEPVAARNLAGQPAYRTVGRGAERERNTRRGGGPRQADVAVGMLQAVESRRRDDHRHLRRLAEDVLVQRGHATAHERPRRPRRRLQGFAVAAQRDLVLGPALGVLERERRDATGRDPPQFFDVARAPEVRSRVIRSAHDRFLVFVPGSGCRTGRGLWTRELLEQRGPFLAHFLEVLLLDVPEATDLLWQ